jgi:hypothetical protein
VCHVVQADVTKRRQLLCPGKGQSLSYYTVMLWMPIYALYCLPEQNASMSRKVTFALLPTSLQRYALCLRDSVFIPVSLLIPYYDALSMLRPPSGVKATILCPFAPQATSRAGTAFLTGSDQLFDALVYWCTETLPVPAAARNWPV